MSALYLRKLSLVLADAKGKGLDFEQFRCTFQVRRGDVQTPNSLDARIYNLAPQTERIVAAKEFTQIALSAGYEDNFGLIFRGNIKQWRRGRIDQKDSYVDLTAADGDEAYNFSPMALTLQQGAKPANALQAIIKNMAGGIQQGYTPQLSQNGSIRGRVFYGQVRDELRDFAAQHNCLWSIQDGQLVLIPKGSYIPGEPVIVSPSTGLIGVPELTQNGLELRMLLNPQIKIGQLIKLDSNAVNQFRFGLDSESQGRNLQLQLVTALNADGLYYVMNVDHIGDSRGPDWYSRLTCLSVNANVPADAANQGAIAPGAVAIPQS